MVEIICNPLRKQSGGNLSCCSRRANVTKKFSIDTRNRSTTGRVQSYIQDSAHRLRICTHLPASEVVVIVVGARSLAVDKDVFLFTKSHLAVAICNAHVALELCEIELLRGNGYTFSIRSRVVFPFLSHFRSDIGKVRDLSSPSIRHRPIRFLLRSRVRG